MARVLSSSADGLKVLVRFYNDPNKSILSQDQVDTADAEEEFVFGEEEMILVEGCWRYDIGGAWRTRFNFAKTMQLYGIEISPSPFPTCVPTEKPLWIADYEGDIYVRIVDAYNADPVETTEFWTELLGDNVHMKVEGKTASFCQWGMSCGMVASEVWERLHRAAEVCDGTGEPSTWRWWTLSMAGVTSADLVRKL